MLVVPQTDLRQEERATNNISKGTGRIMGGGEDCVMF